MIAGEPISRHTHTHTPLTIRSPISPGLVDVTAQTGQASDEERRRGRRLEETGGQHRVATLTKTKDEEGSILLLPMAFPSTSPNWFFHPGEIQSRGGAATKCLDWKPGC